MNEGIGSLDFTLNIQEVAGDQDNGDIVFGVEALTASQYLAITDQPDLCQSRFSGQLSESLSEYDPAECRSTHRKHTNTYTCTSAL